MKRKRLTILLFTALFLTITSATLGYFYALPKGAGSTLTGPAAGESRPSQCQTTLTGSVIGTGAPIAYRCATISPDGYSLHLWYGDENGPKDDRKFVFVGTSDYGVWGAGDIGKYIYRNRKQGESDYYVAVELTGHLLTTTHHFRSGQDHQWDEFATFNRDYEVIPVGSDVPNLPDYEKAIDRSGRRFVWRIVVNGKVLLNNNPVGKGEAYVKLKPDGKQGPPLDEVGTNDSGEFEFSRNWKVGMGMGNEEIWINQKTVGKLSLYVGLTKNNQKYETWKEINFTGDFKKHGTADDALVDKVVDDISLTDQNKVDNFTEPKEGEKSVSEETFGGSENRCEEIAGCGGLGGWVSFKGILCKMGCAVYEAIGAFINWAIERLNTVTGVTLNIFIPEKAYAAPLSEQLTQMSVVTGWKFSLAITDIIIIFALLVVAFANILKLNIDIYAVKKALPGLLIGVVLANLSLLICRVIVDFASLLSSWLLDRAAVVAGIDRNAIGSGLASLMGITPTATGATLAAGILAIFGALLIPGGATLGCVLIIGSLLFLAMPGILILAIAFLMYARLFVIWILVILSPLAFIVLGFPPAQQYFKTWWSWFLNWVFIAPIVYFFIGLGAVLGSVRWTENEDLSTLGRWILGVVVMGMALYVPQKIGGAIMAGWGRLLQKATGTEKGGYLRKLGGFATQSAGTGLLVNKGGRPTWLGRKFGALANWTQTKQAQKAETLRSAITAARQPKLQQINEKLKRGEALTPNETLLLKASQSEAAEMATKLGLTNINPEAILSQIGQDAREQANTIEQFMQGKLTPQRAAEVGAALYALKTHRNQQQVRPILEDLGRQAGYDLISSPYVYAARPISSNPNLQTAQPQPQMQTQTQGALQAQENEHISAIYRGITRLPNITTDALGNYGRELEGLYQHLTTGGTWKTAQQQGKTAFQRIRPDIDLANIDQDALRQEVEDTLHTVEAASELNLPPTQRIQEVVTRVNIIKNQKVNITSAHSDLSTKLQSSLTHISAEELPARLPDLIQNIELPQDKIINVVHAIRVRRNLTRQVNDQDVIQTVKRNLQQHLTQEGRLTAQDIRDRIEQFQSNPRQLEQIIEQSVNQLEQQDTSPQGG